MSKWTIGGNTFDLNPKSDSGWRYPPVRSKLQPIGANRSIIQHHGFESGTRTIEGLTKSKALRDALLNLHLSGNPFTCTDQDGASFSALFAETPEFPVHIDTSNPANLFQSYDFKLTLIKA
ncbi:MAG: hypothetical protein HY868_25570 [Chloroflexi bacterium]|nr:hypothetical protein [Chloroflexota bacterium]